MARPKGYVNKKKHEVHTSKQENAFQDGYPRYRLTADEESLLFRYRESKGLMEKEALSAGIEPDDVRHFWYKSEMFSIFAKPKQKSIFDIKNKIIGEMKKYSPKYKLIKRSKSKDNHLLVIDVSDLHVGKLSSPTETGETYNVQVAVQRAKDCVISLLDQSSHYNIEKIIFVIGNDILHTDNTKRTTTSGTPQDTDGMWYDNFLAAHKLYVEMIELMLPISDVHIIFNPSNHDFTNGFFLAECVRSWFHNSKNITFDCDMKHRKYYAYYSNLLGFTHGDGAKTQDLPLLMAQESPMWGKTIHRYIYTHHVHHKTAKEIMGITVESMRSPSATDSWHHRNGYQHSKQGAEAFVHHPDKGQIARFSHNF